MYFQSPQSRVVSAEAVHCNQWEQDPVGRTQHMDDDWDLEWKHLLEQLLLQEEETTSSLHKIPHCGVPSERTTMAFHISGEDHDGEDRGEEGRSV